MDLRASSSGREQRLPRWLLLIATTEYRGVVLGIQSYQKASVKPIGKNCRVLCHLGLSERVRSRHEKVGEGLRELPIGGTREMRCPDGSSVPDLDFETMLYVTK